MVDPETCAFSKIGPRGSYGGPINEAASVMAIVSGYRFPGYLGTPRLLPFDLKTNRPRDIVDANTFPICFLPNGSLLYERHTETTQAPLFGFQTGKSLPDLGRHQGRR